MINRSSVSSLVSKGGKTVAYGKKKMSKPKKQGYNSRLDEKLGMKNGKESKKKVSMKGRRKQSYGAKRAMR